VIKYIAPIALAAITAILTSSNVFAQTTTTSTVPTIEFSRSGTSIDTRSKIRTNQEIFIGLPATLFSENSTATNINPSDVILGITPTQPHNPIDPATLDALVRNPGKDLDYGLGHPNTDRSTDGKNCGHIGTKIANDPACNAANLPTNASATASDVDSLSNLP
jgi:hypothetical protein